MPPRTRTENGEEAAPVAPVVLPASAVTVQDRIAAFAMLDRMEAVTQAAKCLRLSLCGFPVAEIASLLQTTPATVSQNLYMERKKARLKAGAKPTGGATVN